jgi:hypothetical protein
VSLIHVEMLTAVVEPLLAIKRIREEALRAMDKQFNEIDAEVGAPSIPPETPRKGKVLHALYTLRTDRQLCARL